MGEYRPGKLSALQALSVFGAFFFACSEKKHAIDTTVKSGQFGAPEAVGAHSKEWP